MRIILTVILASLSLNALNAQNKVFLTKDFLESSEVNAYYYRIFEADSSNQGFIQKDYWYSSGKLYQELPLSSLTPYKINGTSRQYYENGQVKYEIQYLNSRINGYVKGYYETGQLKREDFYRNDTLLNGKCYTLSGADTTHYPYFKYPEYKDGGLEGFRKFIARNLKYPSKAVSKGVQGRVYVYFCIASNGAMTDVRIQNSDNKLLNKEAIRVVMLSSGDWAPGYYEGKVAKIALTMPINFVIN